LISSFGSSGKSGGIVAQEKENHKNGRRTMRPLGMIVEPQKLG